MPYHTKILKKKTKLLIATGDYKNAVLSYAEALPGYNNNLVSGSSEAYYTMEKAELLMKLQRYDEVISLYNSVLEDDPENTAAWIGLGDAYLYRFLQRVR